MTNKIVVIVAVVMITLTMIVVVSMSFALGRMSAIDDCANYGRVAEAGSVYACYVRRIW